MSGMEPSGEEAPRPEPTRKRPGRKSRRSLAEAGQLTEQQEKFINLRVRGLAPHRAVEVMDQESDPPVVRTKGARRILAMRLEDETTHFQRDWISWENMDDAEFEAFRMRTLERMVMFPKETAAFAASALEKIAEIRKSRAFANQENMLISIQHQADELLRLAEVKNWLYIKTGQREAQKGPKQATDNTAVAPGRTVPPGFGGEPSVELEHAATLSVLSSFIDQETHLLNAYKDLRERLTNDVNSGKIRAPQPEPAGN